MTFWVPNHHYNISHQNTRISSNPIRNRRTRNSFKNVTFRKKNQNMPILPDFERWHLFNTGCHLSFFLDFSASNQHYNISHKNASFSFKFHKKCKVSQIPKKASPLVKKIKICLYYLVLKGDTFFILGVTFCHQMILKVTLWTLRILWK